VYKNSNIKITYYMGAANSSVAVSSSDSIHVARQHAQLACAQLTSALCAAKVLARVGVKVDLVFARQTLEFKVTQAMIDAGATDNSAPNVFPPESVDGMVKDVQRLTAMVAARNLDTVFRTATATRCFTAGAATFLVSVSVEPEDYYNARRPSLIAGKSVAQVGEDLSASMTDAVVPSATTPAPPADVPGINEDATAAAAAAAAAEEETKTKDTENFMNRLKAGILVTKHPRKGSPEARQFWFTGDRFCIAKKIQKKVSKSTKGWTVDDPKGFDVVKGHNSPVFERTIKKYGEIDSNCCLSVQLNDRTIDLQFGEQTMRDMVYTAIKSFLPDMGESMEKKFTQSLGIGIGKRAQVAKVVVDGAGAVNDVRVDDVILEINGEAIAATTTAKVITDKLSTSLKEKGEVVVKFARAENAVGSNGVSGAPLTETQQNVNQLMDLMFRAGVKLSHAHTGAGERDVEVSCKHPLTEMMIALHVVDTSDLIPDRTDLSPTGTAATAEVKEEVREGKNTDLVDGAVDLLNSNLLPVFGASAAISEGSAQLKELNGSIVMHCTIADPTLHGNGGSAAPVSPEKQVKNIPAPPQLAKESSMLDLGKKGDNIGRTNSVLQRSNSMVLSSTDAAAISAGAASASTTTTA
jgi:hypothetical protein